MRNFDGNLENLVTGRGLYRVWEPACKGESVSLVARWIDPSREKSELQESEGLLVGDEPGQLRIRRELSIRIDVSLLSSERLPCKKSTRKAAIHFSGGERTSWACNVSVKSATDTARFWSRSAFAVSDAAMRRTPLTVLESSGGHRAEAKLRRIHAAVS